MTIYIVEFITNENKNEKTYQTMNRMWFYTEEDARKFGDSEVRKNTLYLNRSFTYSILQFNRKY